MPGGDRRISEPSTVGLINHAASLGNQNNDPCSTTGSCDTAQGSHSNLSKQAPLVYFIGGIVLLQLFQTPRAMWNLHLVYTVYIYI